MEMEPGKLFIGGISWDTDEERLREYFHTFGEVVEAVIMKDRTTGRARGFGFIVFADAAVAERVVKEKHTIDGRTVEAKKAVPRDDHQPLNRNSGSLPGSPGPTRTKKIFVGGLASTVTEGDFKDYFDQFGSITDVVVMYDHNTQRPRGFGFITYDSEEAVDKVLLRTFHELNGKMVEVKRAVPKELSPGPTRSPLGGYNSGLSRVSSFLNAYSQGYNPNTVGGYGVRVDGRFSPVTVGRSGYPPFSPAGYGMGQNSESGLSTNYGGSGNFSSDNSYGRILNPTYSASPNRYNNLVGYGISNGGSGSVLSSTSRNMWGNASPNYSTNSANASDFLGSGSRNSGMAGAFGSIGAIWGSSLMSGQGGETGASFTSGPSSNISYSNAESFFGLGGGLYGRNNGSSIPRTPTYVATNNGNDEAFGNFYASGSFYRDPTWRSSSPELEGPFGYELGNAGPDTTPKNSVGYVGYSVTNRSNRGRCFFA
ncbi:hypothetical protein RJ640_010151 [Escallonia rubra]|uniref:RRM domain-containing protein n=1 Tax=Escallonia rubra TaxID=112253 RepID=A0AA88QY40_9ASTE|nr:hypothetical protein RJ640_010151 [Escallonia rubra]